MILGSTSAIGAVVAVAIAVPVGLLALSGCSATPERSAHVASTKYGGLPSFLPKDSLHEDSALIGTVARPAITSEGDAVKARFAGGTAVVTVVGPTVPGEGLPHQSDSTTCTWTVTVTATSGTVNVSAGDFTSIDHFGAVYRPALVAGQPIPPSMLRAGHTATFELRTIMTVGEGLMRWAPDHTHIVGSWDFEVEND